MTRRNIALLLSLASSGTALLMGGWGQSLAFRIGCEQAECERLIRSRQVWIGIREAKDRPLSEEAAKAMVSRIADAVGHRVRYFNQSAGGVVVLTDGYVDGAELQRILDRVRELPEVWEAEPIRGAKPAASPAVTKLG